MKEKSNNIAKFTAVDVIEEKGEIAMFCTYCGKENPNKKPLIHRSAAFVISFLF